MKRFVVVWHGIILLLRVWVIIFAHKGGIFPLYDGSSIWSQKDFFSLLQPRVATWETITSTSWDIVTSLPDISWSPIAITQENSSQTVSLSTIMDNISDGAVSQWSFTTIANLRSQYAMYPTKENALALITQLSREFEYDAAYTVFKDLDFTTQYQLDPHLVLRILFNSSLISDKNKDILTIQTFIDQSFSQKTITSDEQQRYMSLLWLTQWNMTWFFFTLKSLSSTGYLGDTIKTLQSRIAQAQQWRDIPAYYTQGMLTLGLFEHGYIILSQQLSLDILKSYPNYILPKQILWYTHIILKQRREAKAYFLDLITFDPANSAYYQFFVGVSSYWMQSYVDAILYLTQIPSDFAVIDVTRYKILAYLQLKDPVKVVKSMKELIGKTDIRSADFLLFWEQAIFEPYMKKWDYVILNQDNTLLDAYLKRCNEGSFDKDVCMLWEIWQQVILKQFYQLDQMIVPIIDKFPHAYLYTILGQTYASQSKNEEAKKYFVKALSLTKDEQIKKYIKQQLQAVL